MMVRSIEASNDGAWSLMQTSMLISTRIIIHACRTLRADDLVGYEHNWQEQAEHLTLPWAVGYSYDGPNSRLLNNQL